LFLFSGVPPSDLVLVIEPHLIERAGAGIDHPLNESRLDGRLVALVRLVVRPEKPPGQMLLLADPCAPGVHHFLRLVGQHIARQVEIATVLGGKLGTLFELPEVVHVHRRARNPGGAVVIAGDGFGLATHTHLRSNVLHGAAEGDAAGGNWLPSHSCFFPENIGEPEEGSRKKRARSRRRIIARRSV
jgi:hypothetical protein